MRRKIVFDHARCPPRRAALPRAHHILDDDRRHVLPARRDQDLLDPPRDGEEAVLVPRAHVARVVPAVPVKHFPRPLLGPEVAHEHVAAAHAELARARRDVAHPGGLLVKLGVEAGQVAADGAGPGQDAAVSLKTADTSSRPRVSRDSRGEGGNGTNNGVL